VEMLAQSVAVEIHASDVEPCVAPVATSVTAPLQFARIRPAY
jgi:hypothetical protein